MVVAFEHPSQAVLAPRFLQAPFASVGFASLVALALVVPSLVALA